MALANYNGWQGFVREARNKPLYAAMSSGELVVGSHCLVCTTPASKEHPMGTHSEEYGSTADTYIKSCVSLCHACHAVVHMRHKYPAVWRRYKKRMKDGVLPPRFPNVMAAFQNIFRAKREESPITNVMSGTWLDSLSEKAYDGPDKIATAIRNGIEIPDPTVYPPATWKTFTGVVVDLGGAHHYGTYHRTDAGVKFVLDPPF